MDIIEVMTKVLFVSNDMIPESMLPNLAGGATALSVIHQERLLETLHESGSISVNWLDDQVEMIRENYPCVQFAPCAVTRNIPRTL